jgi:hypothetical protein
MLHVSGESSENQLGHVHVHSVLLELLQQGYAVLQEELLLHHVCDYLMSSDEFGLSWRCF